MNKKTYKILLLTNRESDNCGDQTIELCDISLIQAVMKNLGVENYKIDSRSASMVSPKYVETRNPKLLETAHKLIKGADLVIFGGAPLFNYERQIFYEKTAVTVEIAEQYHVPVLFSAIGIETYEEENEKCQRLKKAVNLDCVKQITTRDHYDLLEKLKSREDLLIGRVADPAVFTSQVFEHLKTPIPERKKKKIGLFILRVNGFTDNGFQLPKEKAAELWLGMIKELKARGYDYELLTSGHFGDEAFMDELIREYDVNEKKCVFNMNTPEMLVNKIRSYDAIVACRLHPSILAFSLKVPAVGLIWNSKVTGFYDSMGYRDRAMSVEGLTPQALADKLEEVMEQGVAHNTAYLNTVYETLFSGIKMCLHMQDNEARPYSYEELVENLNEYEGTSIEEEREKIKRKFRRTYRNYNSVQKKSPGKLLKSYIVSSLKENVPLLYRIAKSVKHLFT